MVYSVRSNRPIVSVRPLKTKRVQGAQSKALDDFAKTYRVSVQTDASGKVIVNAIRKQND